MSAALFTIMQTNPNEAAGGGGCACSPVKLVSCKGPYAVFYGTELLYPKSPMLVLSCTCAAVAALRGATPSDPDWDAIREAFVSEPKDAPRPPAGKPKALPFPGRAGAAKAK